VRDDGIMGNDFCLFLGVWDWVGLGGTAPSMDGNENHLTLALKFRLGSDACIGTVFAERRKNVAQ
jgi:hypothetical protein